MKIGLEEPASVKFLEIIIDKDLSSTSQITNCIWNFPLRNLCNYCKPDFLRTIYFRLIQPHISYRALYKEEVEARF